MFHGELLLVSQLLAKLNAQCTLYDIEQDGSSISGEAKRSRTAVCWVLSDFVRMTQHAHETGDSCYGFRPLSGGSWLGCRDGET